MLGMVLRSRAIRNDSRSYGRRCVARHLHYEDKETKNFGFLRYCGIVRCTSPMVKSEVRVTMKYQRDNLLNKKRDKDDSNGRGIRLIDGMACTTSL